MSQEHAVLPSVQHYLGIMPYNYPLGSEDQESGTYCRVCEAVTKMLHCVIPLSAIAIFPQKSGLGLQMAEYFKQFVWDVTRITPTETISRDETWGTARDIAAIIEWICTHQKITLHNSGGAPCVHFVTDPIHMRRVRLVWKRLGPKEWDVRFHEASGHVRSDYERWCYEPLAYAKYWLIVWRWTHL